MKSLLVSSLIVSAVLVGTQASFGGHSNSFRKQDDYGNYAFAYDIKNGHGAANGRKESGGPHGVVGSYYIGDVDGRHRTVHYVADKAGFRAQIKTNEPGTKTSYPAAAAYHSAHGPTAPSGSYGFHGVHGAAHIAAPVYAKAPYGHHGIAHGLHHHGVAHGLHHYGVAHGPHHYGAGHLGGHYAPVAHFASVNHFAGGPHGHFYG